MNFTESSQPQSPVCEMQIPESCSPGPSSSSKPERKNHERARPANHIPRPENCWILYRKDFVKKGIIPPEVESKQHNLSRIACVCWKRLSDSEREVWRALSELKKQEHMNDHPGYKYSPKKRGPVQKRKRATTNDEELAHCHNVREKYVPAATGSVVQASTSKPPRQRKSARHRDEDDYLPTSQRRARPREPPSINTVGSPVFMSPLLPPQTSEKVSHPFMDTALVSPAFPDVAAVPSTEPDTEDDWTVQQPVPILAPVPRKPPYNAAIHIRENYEISRRGAIAPTVDADYRDAQAWYNPQPFFATSGNAQRTPLPPVSTSCYQAPHSSLERSFPCPEQIGTVFNASPSASSSHNPNFAPNNFAAFPGSAEPQPFPITLRSSASTLPNPVVLHPPQFDATPNHLDTLTITFDERTLKDFSAGLGVDDQFDLFGQPPSELRLGSNLESTVAWSSRMMRDVLSQEVCSRNV